MAKKFDKQNFTDLKSDVSIEKVETNQPAGRFSTSKEVLTTSELGATSSSIPGSGKAATTANVADAAKKVKSKMKIAPDVSVQELEGKQVGGVPLSSGLTLNSVAGFSGASTVDDSSKIPYTNGGYRPGTREGKKRSEILFEMDNTISEQVVPEVDDAKDLSEDPDSLQGYNGRKQFKSARSKKNFAFRNGSGTEVERMPQQLLNEASVDFISSEKTIYSVGQMIDWKTVEGRDTVARNIDIQADYPTVRSVQAGTVENVDIEMHKGNYKPIALNLTIADGMITGVSITEEKYEVVADPLTRDEANMNWQIDANNIAKSQIKLQKELGRETTDKWSPLGYVINQPYQYNMLMHDIEASTGAICAMAYRAACSSLAFQRNILAKDGVNPQYNAVKMICEGYLGTLTRSNDNLPTNFDQAIWLQSQFKIGSVASLISMFDSTSKYHTKADLMGMQRSLTLHLAQAGNNIAPMHVKKEFIKAMDKAHLFSTPSGSYNPLLPIYVTSKMDLILPMSLNAFLVNWKNPASLGQDDYNDPLRDATTGTYANYAYAYNDVRNVYTTRVQHPFIEGLLLWMLKHEGAIVKTYGEGTTTIPFEFNLTAPGLLPFMICAASQDIVYERNICFRDVLFAGEQSTYIWDDLVDLKTMSPLTATQFTMSGYNTPLKLGKMSPDSNIREFWGTHWDVANWENVTGTNNYKRVDYFAPWYFNEHAYGNTAGGSYTANEGFRSEPTAFCMTSPSIRDGVRHEYVDYIKSMNDRDIRLSLDRQLDLLHFNTATTDGELTTFTPLVGSVCSNYIKLSALRYEGNSDGRLIVSYDLTSGSNRDIHYQGLYCIPKEIGYIEDRYAPSKLVSFAVYNSKDKTLDLSSVRIGLEHTAGLTGGNVVYNGSKPYVITSYRVAADSYTQGALDRSAALTQCFYRYFASAEAVDINADFIERIGIAPSISIADEYVTSIPGVYNLDSVNTSTHAIDVNLQSIASRVWTGIQRLFYPVNPFENGAQGTADYIVDPLETSFYFGVCGTLASDYTQDILARLDVRDQLGLDYTEDIFAKDSLIFR